MTKVKKHIRLSDIEKINIFSVPDLYFSFSVLKSGGKLFFMKDSLCENIYQVPDGYFEKLPSAILSGILQKNALADLKWEQSPFSVPELYFEKQADRILDKVLEEKIADGLKQSIYSVPEEYFDSLANEIEKKTTREKIYKLPQNDFIPSLNTAYKYAVAAGMSILVLLGGLHYFSVKEETETAEVRKVPAQIGAEKLIARLSKKEIHAYLDLQDNVETADIIEVSTQKEKVEIEKYFEKYILPKKLKKKEKQDLEIEIEDINIEDLEI